MSVLSKLKKMTKSEIDEKIEDLKSLSEQETLSGKEIYELSLSIDARKKWYGKKKATNK